MKRQYNGSSKQTVKQRLMELVQQTSPNFCPSGLNRVQFEIPSLDLIPWLKAQNNPIKLYASERNRRYEVAGVGAADLLTDCETCDFLELFPEIRKRLAASHPQIKYFGGLAFNQNQDMDDDWALLGKYYFVVPRFEIFVRNGQTFFACNYRVNAGQNGDVLLSALLRQLDELTFFAAARPLFIPSIEQRVDLPQKLDWEQSVRRATRLIKTTALNKVVLSRKTTLNLAAAAEPFDLMNRLQQISTDSFDFCLQPAAHTAFLGSTPELLYQRQGRAINSEAIAGTRPRGQNAAADKAFYNDLANSPKDRQEHLVVVDNVLETLQGLCTQVDVLKKLEILQLSLVQHLYTRFRGELKAGVTDEDILAGLHPTPSVLGEPKQQAFADLANLEPYARGWYAGPLGWIGADEAMFVVGIRSGLLNGDRLSLFSGAGIVAGSDPEKEWDEIENKLGQFLKVFQPVTAGLAQPVAAAPGQWRRKLAGTFKLGDTAV